MALKTLAGWASGVALAVFGVAAQAQTYAYGGLGYGSADYEYAYEFSEFAEIGEVQQFNDVEEPGGGNTMTEFSHQGLGAFVGIGRIFATRGGLTLAGEIDLAAGDWASDMEVTATAPCFIADDGCEGSVDAMMTLRGVMAFESAGWSPFLTAGLAVARISGNADTDACGFTSSCEYDETRTGWVLGAGFTRPISDRFDLRVDYLYADLGAPEFSNPDTVTGAPIVFQQVRIGAQMNF